LEGWVDSGEGGLTPRREILLALLATNIWTGLGVARKLCRKCHWMELQWCESTR
jgi:hypothetical protein